MIPNGHLTILSMQKIMICHHRDSLLIGPTRTWVNPVTLEVFHLIFLCWLSRMRALDLTIVYHSSMLTTVQIDMKHPVCGEFSF
jgi:hypothetical protein